MIIREYKNTDTEKLIDIWYNASLIAHSFISKDMWDLHKDEMRNKYLPMAETWVAEEDGEVLGFISLLENYIGGLFIDPFRQGKGIGSKLIEKANTLKGQLTVGVYEKNEGARRFYEKMGFRYKDQEVQEETGEIVLNMILDERQD